MAIGHRSHSQLAQARNCERYRTENRKEKNSERKKRKWQKFLARCKDKWLRGTRILRGTKRKLRRKLEDKNKKGKENDFSTEGNRPSETKSEGKR